MTNENAATTNTAAAVAEQGAHVAPEKASSKKGASPKENAPKAHRAAKGGKPKPSTAKKATPSKKAAQVVAMLQRNNGATLAEIMEKMAWQKHTVRGFMAGAMKKAGYNVESFKPEGGERTYRINK